MSEKILVIGCGSHSRFILSLLTDINKYQISGLIETNNSFVKDEKILNFPVIGSINNIKLQSTKNVVFGCRLKHNQKEIIFKVKETDLIFQTSFTLRHQSQILVFVVKAMLLDQAPFWVRMLRLEAIIY